MDERRKLVEVEVELVGKLGRKEGERKERKKESGKYYLTTLFMYVTH